MKENMSGQALKYQDCTLFYQNTEVQKQQT